MVAQKTRLAFVAAFAVAAIGATSANAVTRADNPSANVAVAPPEANLVVDNRNSLDVSVYVVRDDGRRKRLGTVRRLNTRTFTIPSWAIESDGDVRIKVYSLEPTASHTLVRGARAGVKTNPLHLEAGETIRLLIEGRLELSSIAPR